MSARTLALIFMMIAVAMVFVGSGLAYSASTSNDGNSVSSEYVILEQRDYTLTTNVVKVDAYTTSDGTVFTLKNAASIVELGGKSYYGVAVGSDMLKATVTGSDLQDIPVQVQTFQTGFTDYSAQENGWRYILKIVATIDQAVVTQYALYDGGAGQDTMPWTLYQYSGDTWVESDSLDLKEDVEYGTTLYFAGVYDDSRHTASSPIQPATNGKIIDNGTIKFVYDSSFISQENN